MWIANYDDITGWSDSDSDDVLDTIDMGQIAITGVSTASEAVVTTGSAHGFNVGDEVYIIGTSPMTGLVGKHFVKTTPLATTMTLYMADGVTVFDSSALAPYSGSVVEVLTRPFFEVKTEDNIILANSNFKVTGGRFFVHQVGFKVLNSGAAVIEFFEGIALGRFVVIVLTKNGAYEIYGRGNGLTAREDDSVVSTNGPTNADAGITANLLGDELVLKEAFIPVDFPYIS